MPRPVGTPKAGRPCVKRPDLDKLVRTVFDAFVIAGVIADDAQIIRLMTEKRLAALHEPSGIQITIARP